jgi:hypothetical protein
VADRTEGDVRCEMHDFLSPRRRAASDYSLRPGCSTAPFHSLEDEQLRETKQRKRAVLARGLLNLLHIARVRK